MEWLWMKFKSKFFIKHRMKKNNIYNHIYDKLKHQKSDDEEED